MSDAVPSPTRYSAPAAACAAEALRLLGSTPEPLSVAQIARDIGRSKSLVFRVIRELETSELVERVGDGRYALSFGILEITSSFLTGSDFMRSVQAALRELSQQTGETSNMGVLRERDVLYVVKQEGRHSVMTISHVGARIPASCSALGKAMMSQFSDDEIREIVGDHLTRLTPSSIATVDQLLEDIAATRERGYAVEEGESILGRCCLAMPIRLVDHGTRPAAISVSMSAERYAEARDTALRLLAHTASRLDREAGARALLDDLAPGRSAVLS